MLTCADVCDRCDIADDLYAAAAISVQKGLALDYRVEEERIVGYTPSLVPLQPATTSTLRTSYSGAR